MGSEGIPCNVGEQIQLGCVQASCYCYPIPLALRTGHFNARKLACKNEMCLPYAKHLNPEVNLGVE